MNLVKPFKSGLGHDLVAQSRGLYRAELLQASLQRQGGVREEN